MILILHIVVMRFPINEIHAGWQNFSFLVFPIPKEFTFSGDQGLISQCPDTSPSQVINSAIDPANGSWKRVMNFANIALSGKEGIWFNMDDC